MKVAVMKRKVDDLTGQLEELERRVMEVTKLRAAVRKSKTLAARAALEQGSKKGARAPQATGEQAKSKTTRAKRIADLLQKCSTNLRQIMQHRWAWPFLLPVDSEALNIHDYYTVIKNPMDLGSIKDRLDGKEGSAPYTHPMQVCEDVRLVFRNAMTYNREGTDVYVMAETLSKKWEEKWQLQLAPKLTEEDTKQQEDEDGGGGEHDEEESAAEELAVDLSKQLEELGKALHELSEKAAARCRQMTVEEKRQLGYDLGLLPAQNLNRVIQIIAEKQPKFNAAADEVEVDIDAQEPATLWRLQRYVHSVLNPTPQVQPAIAGPKSPPPPPPTKGSVTKKPKTMAH